MTMQVQDWIQRCGMYGRKAPNRNPEKISHVIIHRHGDNVHGWGELNNAQDVAKLHGMHPDLRRVTGRMAYDFVIAKDGAMQQALPVNAYGAHAMQYNRTAIGIAVLGDFRKEPPTPAQWRSLLWLLTVLCGPLTARIL